MRKIQIINFILALFGVGFGISLFYLAKYFNLNYTYTKLIYIAAIILIVASVYEFFNKCLR